MYIYGVNGSAGSELSQLNMHNKPFDLNHETYNEFRINRSDTSRGSVGRRISQPHRSIRWVNYLLFTFLSNLFDVPGNADKLSFNSTLRWSLWRNRL